MIARHKIRSNAEERRRGMSVQASISPIKSRKLMINHGTNAVEGLKGILRGKCSDPVIETPYLHLPGEFKKGRW
jgi:hypothetical protein